VRCFRFIAARKAEHSVKTMCRVLEVSRSGFHAWQRREPSARAREDELLTDRIKDIHEQNRRVYGSPRIHAELRLGDGRRVGRKRVERLMRQAGISGLVARKRGRTTVRVAGVRVCEDLVDRAFLAAAPDRLWVADITYLRTWQGCLYRGACVGRVERATEPRARIVRLLPSLDGTTRREIAFVLRTSACAHG
jgi:putative transposase